MTELDKRLAQSAAAASRKAIEKAFAAGLSITVLRGNRIVEVAPDGTEKLIGVLEDD
ncbi:MAG: hypothetical protein MJ249_00945 [Kiritimatiellae bacterium]|nr:hypothetical protein [Kiritimatiellia bacterium]